MRLLEVKNIEVRYGNIKALNDIDIYINQNEIVSLIGANGAGKSTLLKAITGLEPLSNGEIIFDNRIIAKNIKQDGGIFKKLFFKDAVAPDKISSLGISLVPEGREVFSDLTVLENLEMGAFLIKDKNKKQKKLDEVYELFPILVERKNQKAGSLSGGEQQMLAIARGLMNYPKLLLLDEPGLGLAPLIIKDIFNIIKKINKEDGVTIFLIEQNAKMALKISNRGYVMETGNIVMHDKSSNLLNNPKVKATYLGE